MLKKLSHTVFAEGESTGHAHRAGGGVLYEDADVTGNDGPLRLWETKESTALTHEEHAPHVLLPSPTGRYRIGGVIEYDPFKEAATRVRD
jgi:hypothetical protein